MNSTISLHQYLNKKKTFVIPAYQRGYIWGKRKANSDDLDSVSYILNTIFSKFERRETIFLQGVTVTETNDGITLIDGQQRTTFLYILLKLLGYNEKFDLRYEIREESDSFLKKLSADDDFTMKPDEDFQDIYYFKRTAGLILERIKDIDSVELTNYLLDNVKFLYINIPKGQAEKVFTMMNGNRAKMLDSEIIKAELLRLVSLRAEAPEGDNEWELNMLRSRYAREWDRWLHWWNLPEVQSMYNTGNQLGWLLVAMMPDRYDNHTTVTFESFCAEVFKNSRSIKAAKECFYLLRRTQKRFEDTFNNAIRHNKVGAILRMSNNPAKFVKYYFSDKPVDDENLNLYYLCSFLGLTHDMITDKDGKFTDSFRERYNQTLVSLKNSFIYEDNTGGKEVAFRLLLRLNIDEDNRQNNGQGRKFDFSIWDLGLRSLEHICPKSKVCHLDENGEVWLDGNNKPVEPDKLMKREDIGQIEDEFPLIGESSVGESLTATEHCIGNLVLLYKDDNSTFNDSDFFKKKSIFLGSGDERTVRKEIFKSRHLLHTIYHFAESDWGADQIRNYFRQTLRDFCDTYEPIYLKLTTISENEE